MKTGMQEYREGLAHIAAGQKWWLLILVLTAMLAYGGVLTRFSISVDDMWQVSPDNRIEASCIDQGRLGFAFWNLLFCGPVQCVPFFQTFLAVAALVCAAVAWSLLFRRVSMERLSPGCLLAFASLFISYPLIHEIFLYPGNFGVCFAYLLVAVSLMLSAEAVLFQKAGCGAQFAASVLLASAITSYESFAAVYLSGFLMLLCVHYMFASVQGRAGRWYWRGVLKFGGILLAGVILSVAGVAIASAILGHGAMSGRGAHRDVAWLETGGIAGKVGNLLLTVGFDYGYNALFYSPICTFLVACLIAAAIMMAWCWCRRSAVPVMLVGGLIASMFALSILQGHAARYRTCQNFGIFVGFVFMLLVSAVRHRGMRALLACTIGFLVLHQAKDLNLWFDNDYRRSEMDQRNFALLGQKIQERFGSVMRKPVVILGKAAEYDNLRGAGGGGRDGLSGIPVLGRSLASLPRRKRVSQNNGISLFAHGAEGGNAYEFYALLAYCGYRCAAPTPQQTASAKERATGAHLTAWPHDDCMADLGDCIVVRLGDATWEDEDLARLDENWSEKRARNIDRRRKVLRALFERPVPSTEKAHDR
jgi:hypothetical protein